MAERTARQRDGRRTAADHAGSGRPDDLSRLIVAASADGIVAVDDQGTIRMSNRAAQRLLARPAKDLIGGQFGFPVVAGRSAEVELRLPGGGERVVEMRTTSTKLDGEHLQIVALRDVTLRKQAERQLETALEERSAVLAVAAHELHSPLAAIGVLAHVLADQQDAKAAQAAMPPADVAQIIDRIIGLTSRLQLLVDRLLTAARIDAVGVRPVPAPVAVLEVIMEQLAQIEPKREDIHVSCKPGLTALADRSELSIMLANYLDNALAYASPPMEVRASERNGRVEIRVVDHGPGVPASFAPELFERFTRAPATGQRTEGTGLGLWIVRTLAQANGGAAWYEPGNGAGSVFCLDLPLARNPAASAGYRS
jgi:signal transduction histidine kinase